MISHHLQDQNHKWHIVAEDQLLQSDENEEIHVDQHVDDCKHDILDNI